MAKKKKAPKKLTEGQYWEWRCTTEELKSAKLNEKRVHLEHDRKNKEIEILKLKLVIFKDSLKAARQMVEGAETEYKNFTRKLEEDLGFEFKDVVIDEYTYELKSLEEDDINLD